MLLNRLKFGANKLASIDPRTLKVQEYTLPNAGAISKFLTVTFS